MHIIVGVYYSYTDDTTTNNTNKISDDTPTVKI